MSRIQVEVLTDDPLLADAIRRYWEQDEEFKFPNKVGPLAAELGLRMHEFVAQVAEGGRASVPSWNCPGCGEPRILSSRADYQYKRGNPGYRCEKCRTRERTAATEREAAEDARRRDLVRRWYSGVPQSSASEDKLSLKTAVYLLSLARFAGSEDFAWIAPLDALEGRLAPTRDYEAEVLRYLHERGLIAVHPGSDLEAFAWNGAEPREFYYHRVHWTMGLAPEVAQEIVRMLEEGFRREVWLEHWPEEAAQLWEEILLHECLQYLELVLTEHHLPFKPGPKTHVTFAAVLRHFSVAQIYNFIWAAGRDAAAFYQRGGVTRSHAANTVVGRVQRTADRALTEGWPVKEYRRDRRAPRSMLTQVFFDTALQVGELAFRSSLATVESIRPHLTAYVRGVPTDVAGQNDEAGAEDK